MIAQSGRMAMPLKQGAKSFKMAAPRLTRGSRNVGFLVMNAVKFNYDTKVFEKELVKFADTEEYIYRCVMRHLWGHLYDNDVYLCVCGLLFPCIAL
jgi:hypothetical protein